MADPSVILGKPSRNTVQVIMKPGYVYRKKKSRATIPFAPYVRQNEVEHAKDLFHSNFDLIQLCVHGFFDVPIFKLNDSHKTWTTSSFNMDYFDILNDGVYIAAGEAVICDKEFCLCSAGCYCGTIRFVETFLYCDGTYTQRLIHSDSDDTEALRKMGRHNLYFKACGSKACTFCDGVDAESLY
ncbi:hypothetical protein K440DRAFT_646405 [Wilcoxina mikolae CBS 423.85]|nr:hypothetical protein K440DRAFT_646405 [Wilcoxina mikolae CBS 423.85]